MDVKSTRRENLAVLVSECHPQTLAELERRTGVKANYLSQVTGRGPRPRNMGDQVARRLEVGMQKPVGWMDQQHNNSKIDDLSDDEQVSVLLEEFAKLSEEDAAVLLRLARGLNSTAS